jgi:hypothetical protein
VDGIWIVYLFLAAFPGLIIFAAVYKYYEVVQASRWPGVPGRVVVSTSEARSVKSGDPNSDDTERRNFAKVVFEYTVATRTYQGNRVSIGEDLGDYEVAETLAKYPVGKPVTVYYNPNKRDQSVIERDLPAGLWKGVAIIVLVLIGIILGAIFGLKGLGSFIASITPNVANAPFVTACIGFALLWALFTLAFQRAAARSQSWPTTRAEIVASDIHAFEARDTGDSGRDRWSMHYRPEILYAYNIAGVRYTGDTVKSSRISSTSDAFAKRTVAANPVGKTLEVHYNPDNPSESGVDARFGWLWLLWLVPVGMLTLAWYVAHAAT